MGLVYRFPTFEIDEDKREVRAGSQTLNLQPRVFDLLVCLARHPEPVVPKDELLDAVWPGVTVTDGSPQRAVSLAHCTDADLARQRRSGDSARSSATDRVAHPNARLALLEGDNPYPWGGRQLSWHSPIAQKRLPCGTRRLP